MPDRSSVNEFSVFADEPVVLIRESLIDAASSLDDVAALCPQLADELGESFPVTPRLHGHQGILLQQFPPKRGLLVCDDTAVRQNSRLSSAPFVGAP